MKRIVLTLIFLVISSYATAIEYLPVSEIKTGMRGIGYTVLESDQIEKFDVEVIDIVRNFYPQRDLILVRLLGDKMNHTGVVSGMSGSPIYIDNKLIGALAYSMGMFMKDPIAGVTPIDQMLEIFEKEEKREDELSSVSYVQPDGVASWLNNSARNNYDLIKIFFPQDRLYFKEIKPFRTPLIVTGLLPAVHQKLSPQFEEFNYQLLPGGKVNDVHEENNPQLKPGSAVAAVLVHGDYDISAVGTVTYNAGNKILAFGHPMFNSGPVNIPMASAKVITTLSSLMASNKFAVATDLIGNIRQDRSSGIMGVIGEIPPTIPVNIDVESPVSKKMSYHFSLANDKSCYGIAPVFLWITLVNTLESARFGNGDYALRMRGRIELENSADVVLDNFYSGGSMGYYDGSGLDMSEAAYDVAMTFSALLLNDFTAPRVKSIDLKFDAQPGQKYAEIEKIYFEKNEVVPGDSINLYIYLRPYQGSKSIKIKKEINIPKNIQENSLTLAIGGPGEITQWEQQAGLARFIPTDFHDLVTKLNRRRKNNNLIIQLKKNDDGAVLHGTEYQSLPPSIHQILLNNKTQKNLHPLNEKILREWIVPVEYTIQGGRKLNLEVKTY